MPYPPVACGSLVMECILVHQGRQPFRATGPPEGSRRHTRPEEARFPKTGYFSWLYESRAKLIKGMQVRHTNCVRSWPKIQVQNIFGDRSR